ncbi:MAG: GDSL-type esterase/lipase family protein, partial [Flavobacteriales bacterium]
GQSVAVKERWPVQLKDSLIAKGVQVDTLQIIATTGWRTDNLINGINSADPDSNFNLVSILIGVNNFYQGTPIVNYVPDLKTIIDRAIALTKNDTDAVFLVSIPDYAYTPFGKGLPSISAGIDLYNHLMDSIAQTYGINYFYITNITREGLNEPALVANDDLHPSGKAYTFFVDTILNSIVVKESNKVNEIAKPLDFNVTVLNDRVEVNMLADIDVTQIDLYDMGGKLLCSQKFFNTSKNYTVLVDIPEASIIVVLKNKQGIIAKKKSYRSL